MAVEEEVDRLYALPLDQFTAARNALAKQLKKEGDKDGAAQVQALKKPALVAWALNRLARDDPAGVEALLDAGGEVRRAHRQALQGDASALRAATRKEQQEISALAQRAAGILEGAGSSGGANLDRISSTLRAAATDEVGAELLRRGRMVTDLEASGFELTGGLTVVPSEPATPSAQPTPAAKAAGGGDDDRAAVAAAAQAEAAQAEAERQADERRAERERERAQARADAAEGKAVRLEREAERAEEVARAARERATAARAEADEAAQALKAL